MEMKERLRKRITELTSIIGVSGYEWDVGRYIYENLKDDVDSIYSEQMQTITEALVKIEELKTEIENRGYGNPP